MQDASVNVVSQTQSPGAIAGLSDITVNVVLAVTSLILIVLIITIMITVISSNTMAMMLLRIVGVHPAISP